MIQVIQNGEAYKLQDGYYWATDSSNEPFIVQFEGGDFYCFAWEYPVTEYNTSNLRIISPIPITPPTV